MTGAWWQYLVVFAGSLTGCMVLTPLALHLALRAGVLDHPGGHKSHDSPVPYLGGLAIVGAFSTAVILATVVEAPPSGSTELVTAIGLGIVLAVIGTIDDLKSLSPAVRLIVQILCALAVWWSDRGVTITQIEALDLAITLLWLVGITNAFNLLDNMDGLSAGLAGITSLTYFSIAAANGQYLVAGLSIGLAGCSFGFLRHNFHPARIYMGDGGSLFVGFLIAYLGLKLRFESPVSRSFIVPILACTLAILDTAVVLGSRLWYHRNPFTGGQDHVSHRLVRLGLPVPIAVGGTYVAALVIGVVCFVVARVDAVSAWILTGLVGTVSVVAAGLCWMVPVYPESGQRQFIISESDESKGP